MSGSDTARVFLRTVLTIILGDISASKCDWFIGLDGTVSSLMLPRTQKVCAVSGRVKSLVAISHKQVLRSVVDRDTHLEWIEQVIMIRVCYRTPIKDSKRESHCALEIPANLCRTARCRWKIVSIQGHVLGIECRQTLLGCRVCILCLFHFWKISFAGFALVCISL